MHRLDNSTRSSTLLYGLSNLILWMTDLSLLESISPSDLDIPWQAAYSHDLLSLTEHIEGLSIAEASFSLTECLTMIRNVALGHTQLFH